MINVSGPASWIGASPAVEVLVVRCATRLGKVSRMLAIGVLPGTVIDQLSVICLKVVPSVALKSLTEATVRVVVNQGAPRISKRKMEPFFSLLVFASSRRYLRSSQGICLPPSIVAGRFGTMVHWLSKG